MATPSVPKDQFEVKGKVAIVTGAAAGIGLAITKCLLENGAKVSMVDINGTEGERCLASFRDQFSGDVVSFFQADVSVAKELAKVFEKTKEIFGRLDIVCNNAAIVYGEDKWRRMFEVNVFGVIEGIALAIEHMSITNGGEGGVVINTASTAGFMPSSVIMSKYCATKHAVVGYTRVHKETAQTDGIRINCICPGVVDTLSTKEMLTQQPPMFGYERTEYKKTHSLRPESVAEGVLQLIKDKSKAGDVMAITFENGITFPKLFCSGYV